jgi:hypothetical protein
MNISVAVLIPLLSLRASYSITASQASTTTAASATHTRAVTAPLTPPQGVGRAGAG